MAMKMKDLPSYYIHGVGTPTTFNTDVIKRYSVYQINNDGCEKIIFVKGFNEDRSVMFYNDILSDIENLSIDSYIAQNKWKWLAGIGFKFSKEEIDGIYLHKKAVYFRKEFFNKHKDDIMVVKYRPNDNAEWVRFGGYLSMKNEYIICISASKNIKSSLPEVQLEIPVNEENLQILCFYSDGK